ncbi:MAG: polyamine aminopropyltransferase [Candidatus Moranbacteria bacterium]|nr:polyamine aminopropyltransferase [Candidatus Moranbacteria bacterium]
MFYKNKNQIWFQEELFSNVKQCFSVSEVICDTKSNFQDIKIFETKEFGKVLALDGIVQASEKDEFIYHESITHIPLFEHHNPQNVLIVGGGDGGAVREVTKHASVKLIHLVEIDQAVIDCASKHLPFLSENSLKDKRVSIFNKDAFEFIGKKENFYDIIIVDAPDPIGVAKRLFLDSFYKKAYEALKNGGIAIFQSGSFFLQNSESKKTRSNLLNHFNMVENIMISLPTYYGGYFLLLMAKKGLNQEKPNDIKKKIKRSNFKTNCYDEQFHFSVKLENVLTKKFLG